MGSDTATPAPVVGTAPQGTVTVQSVDPARDARWDRFVSGHPDAHAYHLGLWASVLQKAYGFRPAYLAALSADDRIVGVLPLMSTRGAVTGRRLRSLPIAPIGGPLADSEAVLDALAAAACDLAEREGVKRLTINARSDMSSGEKRLVPGGHHPTWITELPGDPDDLRAEWRRDSKHLHRNLNKAQRNAVTVRESNAEADLKAVYQLYLETMRRHRTLPRSLASIRLARSALGTDRCRVFVAEHDNRVIAGGIFHTIGETVELVYNASATDALDRRPNYSLYWHVFCWAIANGYRRYDWGVASPDDSLGRFKRQWSAVPVPEFRLDYVPSGDGADPAGALRSTSARLDEGRESLPSRVWGKAPLAATRIAGELVYRWA
jgi:CelD/BcsL family acetyltransferase involved in cellulose biosynthesis